ncbi:MAG: hypothetical protein Q7S14_01755 [bacterium]|nr:hypothetical protein [bacterium]
MPDINILGKYFVPDGAEGITLLKMDSGRYELGWKSKGNGRTLTTQVTIENSEDVQAIKEQYGYPEERVEGRIVI